MAPNKPSGRKKTKVRPRATIPKGLTTPVSVGAVISKRDPALVNSGNSVTITNTERFSDVGTSSTSGSYADAVIPIIPTSFPWLATAASCYSMWEWESIEVFYIPQCSTTTNGLVGMAYIYDPRDGPITSMNRLSALSNAVLNPPWAGSEGAMSLYTNKVNPNAVCMRPDRKVYRQAFKYISGSTFSGLSNADQLIYCNLWIDTATANSTSLSTVVGGLYCKYKVRLRDPTYPSANN